ncbi:MAG: hypothetical protein IH946_03565 [Bacteroidetes bacterium]|nr:hypothetical protein [Bacteroidota bacterium]
MANFRVSTNNLKDFKKELKVILRNDVNLNFRLLENWQNSLYEAQLDEEVLTVFIPGIKQIDDNSFRISKKSMIRKRYTIEIFLTKRLANIKANIDRV